MKLLARILFVLPFLLSLLSATYAKDWKGLVPLQSTRAEVEKKFGKGVVKSSQRVDYTLSDARVSITYSDGRCEKVRSNAWNVPDGTVITIEVVPRKLTLIGGIAENLDRFEKLRGDVDLPGTFYYLNETDGTSISVDVDRRTGRETVMSHYYFPTAAERFLKCSSKRTVN